MIRGPVLIGLNGLARSGKDTTADMIEKWCDVHGITHARHGFADKLKESAAHCLGVFEKEIAFCNKLKEQGEITLSTKDDGWCAWFAGFVDGEGCFRVTKKGVPEFQIGLRADDRAVLENIERVLGVGHLYEYAPEGKNPTLYYRVSGPRDCQIVLNTIGDRLRSKKSRDYLLWRDAVDARSNGASYIEMEPFKDAIVAVRKFDSGVPVPDPPFLRQTISGREYLQLFGTEAHRDVFGSDFWVDALLPLGYEGNPSVWIPNIDRPLWYRNFRWQDPEGTTGGHPAEVCLITDCRFDNEAQRIGDLGGQIWRIERDGSGAGSAGKEGHASEQALPGESINLIIDNNGSLSDLAEAVENAMEEVMEVTS